MSHRLAGWMVLTGLVMVGCRNLSAPPPPPPPPPPSADQFESVRREILADDPHALVGRVVSVYQDYAAVEGLPPDRSPIGETLVLSDIDRRPIANARIVARASGKVHVRFVVTAREPQVGDLAVRFSR